MKSNRILVVEDEALIAEDIQRTLSRLGYDVPLVVATGRAAIAAAADSRPNLILMDIKLKGAMDGIEAATVIRREHDTPVVFLTSHSDDATLARAMDTAPSGYLLKPFTDRELRTAIEVALNKHRLEQRLAERERWLSTILQSIGDAVIVTDPNEVITVMNVVAERLTGWSSGSAIGRPLEEVFRLIDPAGMPIRPGMVRALSSNSGTTPPPRKPQSLPPDQGIGIPRHLRLVQRHGHDLPVALTCAALQDGREGVTGAVLVFRDMTREQLQQQRLESLALLDPLTGIANRRTLELRLGHELARSKRCNRPLSCLLLDIDHFKAINDRHGHAVGDDVITMVADLLSRETRAGVDLVARYGGEEFVILLPETELVTALLTAERLRARVAAAEVGPRQLHLTISIGVATDATDDLLLRADRAMYLAKQSGRNRVEQWNDAACRHAPLSHRPAA